MFEGKEEAVMWGLIVVLALLFSAFFYYMVSDSNSTKCIGACTSMYNYCHNVKVGFGLTSSHDCTSRLLECSEKCK